MKPSKNQKTYFIAIATIVLVLSAMYFQPFASQSSQSISQSDRLLDIREIKTPQGLSVWFVKDETLPIISLDFAFDGAGATLDPDEKQGLAQLLSNTLDEGAGPYSSKEFQKLLSDNSIDLSFSQSRDAFTGHIKTLSRNKDLAFELLRLSLLQPSFDQEAVDRMREANKTRIKSSLANPNWIAARLVNDRIYGPHPYARNSGGTLSSLDLITPDDLKNFAQTHFTKDKLKIGIVGNLSEQEVTKLIDQTFGALPDSATKENIPLHTFPSGKEIALFNKPIPQTIIRIIYDGLAVDDPDYYSALVMNYIFGGGGFGSRLMEEIREERGLSYGIYSSLGHLKQADTLTIATSTQNDTASVVLDLIDKEHEKISGNLVSDEELNSAKAFLTGSLPLSLTSTDKISGLLLSLQLDNLPITYLDERNQLIQTVTKEDIKRVAERLLKTENKRVILVGNPSDIQPTKVIETLPNVD